MGLERYISIFTHNQQWFDEIVASFEWIASKAEGHTVLEKMLELHGKPLLVVATPEVKAAGFAVLEEGAQPMLRLNPDHLPLMRMRAADGSEIRNSVDRTISHELAHAAQPNLAELGKEAIERIHQVSKFEPSFEALFTYKERMKAARTVPQLKRLFGEMYDAHLAPQVAGHNKQALQILQADPIVLRYAEDFEKPAIEFENLMMGYKGEKGRSTDYVHSLMEESVDTAGARNLFVEQNAAEMIAMRKAKATASRIGKNPIEIRSDVPPKSTGEFGK